MHRSTSSIRSPRRFRDTTHQPSFHKQFIFYRCTNCLEQTTYTHSYLYNSVVVSIQTQDSPVHYIICCSLGLVTMYGAPCRALVVGRPRKCDFDWLIDVSLTAWCYLGFRYNATDCDQEKWFVLWYWWIVPVHFPPRIPGDESRLMKFLWYIGVPVLNCYYVWTIFPLDLLASR